jgi:hypothetical protein
MTLQTDIAQIKEKTATYAKEIAELCDKALADLSAEDVESDPVTPGPAESESETPIQIISGSLDIITMRNTDTIRLMGRAISPDNYIIKSFWEVTEIIAKVIPEKFPYRGKKKIEIVRGCPISGDGGTHPPGGGCLDLHYCTYGDTDHTQCGEFGKDMIEIWNEEGAYSEKGELTNLFDAECTLAILNMYYLFFPYLDVCTMPKMKDAMGAYGRKYDYIGISLDQPNMYHGSHLHIGILGGHAVPKINKNVTIAELYSI